LFDLLFDARHNVLMTRLHGRYVESDIILRDKAVARFRNKHGPTRGIMDFSDIESVDVTVEFVVDRSARPAPQERRARVIVAPREPAWALTRIFAAHQLYHHGFEPMLVRSLDEAYWALNIEGADFQPLEIDAAGRRESVALDVLAGIKSVRRAAAANEDRDRTRRKMLQLLDIVMTRSRSPDKSPSITLSDVLNAAVNDSRLADTDLKATCSACNRRRPLSHYTLLAGRETTYACPDCNQVMVAFAAVEDGPPMPLPAGYELGGFFVRTAGDIECPGAVLPKSEP
jgi:hypothetical protein